MDIRIRTATPADVETIAGFNRASAEESEGMTLDPKTALAGVRAAMEDPPRCRYYLAETAGRPVGQTMLTYEWSDWRNGWYWWIQSVYVLPEFRRRGVFRSLYEHIRREARADPTVCGLRLYVYRENERALATYRNLGMTVTDYLICEALWKPS
ncbi:MAG: N-acetyltransferase [Planctomycetota bacterium]|nr:MAG: N-acetyltransferase [Planctomycetota bacterium]